MNKDEARDWAQAMFHAGIDYRVPGTSYVEPIELEDDEDWLIIYGAREWLRDGDLSYMVVDDVFWFLNKNTRTLRQASGMDREDVAKCRTMRAAR